MESFLSRYRNLTVLLVVIVGQILLLAYQVKTGKDVPLIRAWAVSAVTPVERGLEFIRRNTIGVVEDYFVLVHVREDNRKLQREMGRATLENTFLKNELARADRVRDLSVFQSHTPSKTLVAEVIGNGTGANSKVVFIDRGSNDGVESGMPVITPAGIAGKVVSAYPRASLVMLITDPSFAAGVISQKNHVRGTLKGTGGPKCTVDYVQNEEKVDPGEMFYTSGDDRIFPRGLPAGQVTSVRKGRSTKEIYVTPAAVQSGIDEVLVVTKGEHQQVPKPDETAASTARYSMPPPPDEAKAAAAASAEPTTPLDKLTDEYRALGQSEGFKYGEGAPGAKPPDFTKLGKANPTPAKPAQPGAARPFLGSAPPAPEAKPATPRVTQPRPKPGETEDGEAHNDNADFGEPAQPPAQKTTAPSQKPPQGSQARPAAPRESGNTEILPPAPPPKNRR